MAGDIIKKPWGFIHSSSQEVDPSRWGDYAKKLLHGYIERHSARRFNILSTLVKIMDRLTCDVPMACGEIVKDIIPGVIKFDEAFRIYQENIETEACDIKTLKKESFQCQVLHKDLGLPVVIVNHKEIGKWIVLKSGNLSLEYLFSVMFEEFIELKEPVVLDYSFSEIKSLMSSEFDRKLLDLAVSVGKSKSELDVLGIQAGGESNEEVKKKIEDLRAIDDRAEVKAKKKLDSEIKSVAEFVKANQTKFEIKKHTWPELALKDLEEKIRVQKERLEHLLEVKSGADEHSKLLLRRRFFQAKQSIVKEEKIKQVGRSKAYKKQGAKRKLNDSDDEYVASMFSEHAGYHGLRNTVTEYVGTVDRNKRIKLEDIRKYYNMRRMERGEKSVSTATARRRLAPRRKTTLAARAHIGKCLISVAVPPRTENTANENTHFARKFRSNLEKCLFSQLKFLPEVRDIDSNSKVLFKSKDDAHYVAPGTKDGFDRARQKKIFCPQDKNKRYGIPKYDFPDSTLYQTPGSHRVLQKLPKIVSSEDSVEKLARDPDWDFHHVYIRPKITQDSSGLTWSSEDVDLIIQEPFITSAQINCENQLSKEQFSCLRALQLETKLFLLMQHPGDEKFLDYNLDRLRNLVDKLKIQLENLDMAKYREHHKLNLKILKIANEVIEKSSKKQVPFSDLTEFPKLSCLLQESLELLEMEIPPVRPIRVDLVDSGPGQAPNQRDVIFCDRILFHLFETNYYARVSLADHDSYMNYAERTNSAISDAMCVGTGINCDIHDALENLSVADVAVLDNRTFKELSFQAQIKNSHHITDQLVQRINGAPCLGNYITGRVGICQEDQFLGFLKPYIQDILAAADPTQVPGGNFALKLENFAESHATRGQLYSEVAREKCLLLEGKLCELCAVNPQKPGNKLITVPQPIVDQENSVYLDVSKSSFRDRLVDDYLPRKNLDQKFKDKELETEEDVLKFSKQFLVDKKFIDKRIQHLKFLDLKKELRKRETAAKRIDRNVKTFDDYDWEEEIETNNFKQLVVKDLKKYCDKYKLGSSGRKDDLKNKVRGHWYSSKSGASNVLPEIGDMSEDSNSLSSLAQKSSISPSIPKLDVVLGVTEDDIVALEDYSGVDSDDDEVVNFEDYYDTDVSDDED